MTTFNPFFNKEAQEIRWMHMEVGVYSFELIMPLKGIVEEYAKGGYLKICAEVLESIPKLQVNKGEYIFLSFPVRTLESAWLSQGRTFRNQVTEDDNLKIIFRKGTRQSILIIELERLKPTEEHIKFAQENYSRQRSNKVDVIVQKPEEI